MSKAFDPDFISGGSGDWKHPRSTFGDSFNLSETREAFEMKKNRYAKFRAMEQSPNGVLLYSNPKVHVGVVKPDVDAQNQRWMTTQQEAMGFGSKPQSRSGCADAPPVMGRSGQRQDKGKNTSGLLGEQFNDGDNIGRNNFVQRAWLTTPDPALLYRKYGTPKAEVPEGMSLSLRGEVDEFDPNARHGRTAGITGNVALTRRGPSVYMDEDYFRIRKYPPPYPDTMMGYSDESGRIETPYEPKDRTKKHFYKSNNLMGTAGARSMSSTTASAGIPPPSAPDMDHTNGYIQFPEYKWDE